VFDQHSILFRLPELHHKIIFSANCFIFPPPTLHPVFISLLLIKILLSDEQKTLDGHGEKELRTQTWGGE
jgi:hypothetical protein